MKERTKTRRVDAFYIAKIKALAKLMGRFGYHSGIEQADLEQEGYLSLISMREWHGDKNKHWTRIEPTIKRAMNNVISGATFSKDKRGFVPLDAINSTIDEEGEFSILDMLDFDVSPSELRLVAPPDPATRFALIERANNMIETIDTRDPTPSQGVVKVGPMDFTATLRLGKRSTVIGHYETVGRAKGALIGAWKTIRNACYPVYPHGRSDKQKIKHKKTDVGFWISMARADNPGTTAAPLFFYNDPLFVLLFLEWVCTDEANDGISPYQLESIDWSIKRRNRKGTIGHLPLGSLAIAT